MIFAAGLTAYCQEELYMEQTAMMNYMAMVEIMRFIVKVAMMKHTVRPAMI